MANRESRDVRILNPFAGRGYTGKKRAERYVRRGVARWVEDSHGCMCLQFVASGPTTAAIAASVARNIGYDCAAYSGIAKFRELANLPMANPARALGVGKRKGASRHAFLAAKCWVD
jgi:hypothetical protein